MAPVPKVLSGTKTGLFSHHFSIHRQEDDRRPTPLQTVRLRLGGGQSIFPIKYQRLFRNYDDMQPNHTVWSENPRAQSGKWKPKALRRCVSATRRIKWEGPPVETRAVAMRDLNWRAHSNIVINTTRGAIPVALSIYNVSSTRRAGMHRDTIEVTKNCRCWWRSKKGEGMKERRMSWKTKRSKLFRTINIEKRSTGSAEQNEDSEIQNARCGLITS